MNPLISLPPGVTPITLVVNDGKADSTPAAVNVTVPQDTVPPVTVLRSLTGIAGNNGWYTSGVTAGLEATDNCSGVKEIQPRWRSGCCARQFGVQCDLCGRDP